MLQALRRARTIVSTFMASSRLWRPANVLTSSQACLSSSRIVASGLQLPLTSPLCYLVMSIGIPRRTFQVPHMCRGTTFTSCLTRVPLAFLSVLAGGHSSELILPCACRLHRSGLPSNRCPLQWWTVLAMAIYLAGSSLLPQPSTVRRHLRPMLWIISVSLLLIVVLSSRVSIGCWCPGPAFLSMSLLHDSVVSVPMDTSSRSQGPQSVIGRMAQSSLLSTDIYFLPRSCRMAFGRIPNPLLMTRTPYIPGPGPALIHPRIEAATEHKGVHAVGHPDQDQPGARYPRTQQPPRVPLLTWRRTPLPVGPAARGRMLNRCTNPVLHAPVFPYTPPRT